jgi:hypothetical protein
LRIIPRTLVRVLLVTTLAAGMLIMLMPAPASAAFDHGFRGDCDVRGPRLFEDDDEVVAKASIDCDGTRVVGVRVFLLRNGRLVDVDTDINRNFARAEAEVDCDGRDFYHTAALVVAQDFRGVVAWDLVWGPARIFDC